MTAITPMRPEMETADLLAPTARPRPRGQRATPRFQLPTDGAADGRAPGRDSVGRPAGRKAPPGPDGADATGAGVMPVPTAGAAGPDLLPGQMQAANLPAPVTAAEAGVVPEERASAVEGPGARATRDAPGRNVRLSAEAGPADAGRAQAARADAGPEGAGLEARGAGPDPSARQPAPAAGPSSPGTAQAGTAAARRASGGDADAVPSDWQQLSAQPAARRERGASPAAAGLSVRLEAAASFGESAPGRASSGGAPSAQSGRSEGLPGPIRAEGLPETPQPADVLIAQGAGGAGGLDVTIAAATAALRDRFRASAGELQADLAAIGAEVDAIRVELRGDPADGGLGPDAGGGSADGAGAAPEGRAPEAGWDRFEALARLDGARLDGARLDGADPGAGGEAGRDGGADGRDGEADGLGERGGSAPHGGPGDQGSREGERLRLLLTPVLAAAGRAAEAAEAGSGQKGLPPGLDRQERIDRYA